MKKIISILACVAIATSFVGCKKKTEVKDYVFETETMQENPVTKVGSIDITKEIYNFFYKAYFEQTGKEDQARELANKEIVNVYVPLEIGKKMKLKPETKDDIYKRLKGSLTGKEYDKYLESRGVSDDFFKQYAEAIAYDTAIRKYVLENVENNIDPDQFFRDNYLRAKHVLIQTTGLDDAAKAEKKVLAEDILNRAKGGEDFDALVSQYSEDPGSQTAVNGYVFPEGQMVDEFYNGTKSIAVGEVTLVESSYGFHIIKRYALDETPELYQEFFTTSAVDEQIEIYLIDDFKDKKVEEYNIEIVY